MPSFIIVALDREHLIHPLANFREHERKGVTVLESGRGAFLRDSDGNELLDAFSGLWCVNVGYGQESIVRAAAEQMSRLPYATGYFGFGSEPAIRLAARLIELAPASLRHVYFTLGGSDAVDAAVRYITHYYNSIGRPRKKHFIALERGYHGSSSLGSGLTALPAFHFNFDVPQPNQHHIPSPYPYRNAVGEDPQAIINASVAALRARVNALGAEHVAAFFCEPIQGSGGVIVPPRGWLKAMSDACRELGILFVVDEVITGFGRTGPLFACEAEGVEPDLMTVAKGLTAGYAPMGAVLMSEEVYDGIADGSGKRGGRSWPDVLGASGERCDRTGSAASVSRGRVPRERRRTGAAFRAGLAAAARTSARWRCAPARSARSAGARRRQGDAASLRSRAES